MRFSAPASILVIASTCHSLALAQDKTDEAKASQVAAEPTKKDGVTEITFDDLKFDIAKDAKFERKMLGEKIEALAGKQVKVTGYIWPTSVFMREGIKTFVLVYKDLEHCVDPFPTMHQVIRVEMEGDKTTSFTIQPIAIEGEFSIKEWAVINGRPAVVYHIKATSVTQLKNLPIEK